ncbi:MAG: Na+/H+ antiporter [Bryobacteraceae bacterium]
MSAAAAVELILVLLIAVSAVALITSRLKIPYTIALVFAGFAIDLFHVPIQEIAGGRQLLTPEIIFLLFLPGLLFESSINIDVRHLKENMWPIVLLAVVGVAAATAITGYAIHTALGLEMMVALLFGALISATDPISVIALFRDLGVKKRLAVIVEGESLFNDGTAAVVFQVILAGIVTGHLSAAEGMRHFVVVAFGGLALGLVLGYAASKITAQVDEPRIEITLTTILAYGSYLLAEHLHVSGVIATVAAGLMVGNYGALFGMSARTRVALWSFWEYAAFVINSMVFLLVGIEVHIAQMLESWWLIGIATMAVLLGRVLVVYLLAPLASRYTEPIPMGWQHVLVWGGLHGSVSIALALSLPQEFEHRALLLTMTFGVVAFSIVVQGLSMKPLLRRLGLIEQGEDDYTFMKARQLELNAARRELNALLESRSISQPVFEELTAELKVAFEAIESQIGVLQAAKPALVDEETRIARVRMIEARRAAVQRAVIGGVIPPQTGEHLLATAARERQGLVSEGEAPA